MNSSQRTSVAIPEEVVRQAIAWRIKLESRGQDGATLQACERWRLAQPEHELAWQRLCNLDSTFNKVAQDAPTLAKQTIMETDSELESLSRRQALKNMGGSLCGILAVSWISYEQGWLDPIYADHVTDGSKALVKLADSSQLWLNQHSSVQVEFTDTKRAIKAARGEIHLTAASDRRPFEVTVSQGVLKTQQATFNLREEDDYSLLQVDDGEVWMHANSGYSRQINAGEVVKLADLAANSMNAERFDYSAWVDGVFSVRDIPLKTLLLELSRYRTGLLRSEPTLENHLISGVFQLNDHDLILKTLARTVGAELQYRTRYWVQLKAKSIA
ncbi:FecR domain-containing protein [Pseudoalteromonas luteoviolacea]|uniref:FecR protein domain-containing protein n=1 Tax=Pseudoalteromonas luteoviolacea S4060-1 TaxID=1365257 RepID=A0A167J0U2_9GAMM|nr:FecR domain-containing protein [Pseudoalteromonas luteoviolacea]KZN60351.1 hypothetical protein N478_07280 [Pseudoalteromonas luteoviolacea S4060-1]